VEIGRSAGLQILALLALHPAGLTSRQLAEAIWPNLRPHLASGRFHTTISDLRRTLHTAAGSQEVVARTSGRYQLNPSQVQVDVWRLRSYIDAAATLSRPGDREAALRAVIDTYTGELAVGHQWPWLPPHRESLRRSVIDAYTALAAARPDQAIYLRLAATRIDPVNAYLNRHAIQALTAAGDHATADALTQTYARDLTTAGLTLHPNNDVNQTRTLSPGSA
jgi:two-component SAPR family response regulator